MISFGTFRVSVEVFIPASNKDITIKTSSGKIEAAGEYTASSFNMESTSGNISVNYITAETLIIKSSSGRIIGNNVNGNTTINSSSGSILVHTINGDAFADSSSGRIELNQVSGSLTANTSSGNIISKVIGKNAEIRTSSGRIVFGRIDGGVIARAKSGRIEIDMVNGTIEARTNSGSIHCTTTKNVGDISIITTSGSVTLDIPRNLVFGFSSRSSSGRLNTPFSEKLSSPLSDRISIQGNIGIDSTSENQVYRNINISTSSGPIRINWIN